MAKVKPKNLPYYIQDEVRKDLNEHFGKYAKMSNWLDDQAFDAFDNPDMLCLDEGEKIPLYPFDSSCYIDNDTVQALVLVYWYWAIEEAKYPGEDVEKKISYISEYLLALIEEVKKGAKDLLDALKDDSMDKEEDLEFVLDNLAGRYYCYSEKATLREALERIPGADKESFIREEKEEEPGKIEYRFIDTSFGDDFYSMKRELERRGYKVSDITVTGDDSGDEISMGVDTLLGITDFLKDRGFENQLKHWRNVVEDSKVLSEIEKRSDLLFIL